MYNLKQTNKKNLFAKQTHRHRKQTCGYQKGDEGWEAASGV